MLVSLGVTIYFNKIVITYLLPEICVFRSTFSKPLVIFCLSGIKIGAENKEITATCAAYKILSSRECCTKDVEYICHE